MHDSSDGKEAFAIMYIDADRRRGKGACMKTVDAINQLVSESGMSKKAVSEAMGRSSGYLNSVVEQSNRKGGGVHSSTLSSVASVCGYALALVPLDEVGGGMLVVDPPESLEKR